MKKIILLFTLTTMLSCVFAQKKNKGLDSVVTSTGWVIKQGDTITLGLGTLPNGDFKYITDASVLTALNDGLNANSSYYGSALSKKARETKNALDKRYSNDKMQVFRLSSNQIILKFAMGGRYRIDIEQAIETGELKVPQQYTKKQHLQPVSVADELLKLKSLLDSGAITQDEYNSQKEKILK